MVEEGVGECKEIKFTWNYMVEEGLDSSIESGNQSKLVNSELNKKKIEFQELRNQRSNFRSSGRIRTEIDRLEKQYNEGRFLGEKEKEFVSKMKKLHQELREARGYPQLSEVAGKGEKAWTEALEARIENLPAEMNEIALDVGFDGIKGWPRCDMFLYETLSGRSHIIGNLNLPSSTGILFLRREIWVILAKMDKISVDCGFDGRTGRPPREEFEEATFSKQVGLLYLDQPLNLRSEEYFRLPIIMEKIKNAKISAQEEMRRDKENAKKFGFESLDEYLEKKLLIQFREGRKYREEPLEKISSEKKTCPACQNQIPCGCGLVTGDNIERSKVLGSHL